MWLTEEEIKLFDKVFEEENLMPRNNKGRSTVEESLENDDRLQKTEGYKLKVISFFYTDTKAFTNVCKNLKKLTEGHELNSNYLNVLRKMGLINHELNITKFGRQLLMILHYNDNEILNEINKPNMTIDKLPSKISYIIEFFLFLVVIKCLEDEKERKDNSIRIKQLAFEPIHNLNYFIANIIDTINEISNEIDDVNDLFNIDDEDFYYVAQGINFSGYEIKRLLKLDIEDRVNFIKTFNRVIECRTIPSKKIYNNEYMELENGEKYYFKPKEKKYRRILHYYKRNTQKDIRNRTKHAIINYIIYNSLKIQNKRVKLEKNRDLDKIIKFEEIKKVFKEYDLKSIFNLVYFNKESKYLKNTFKTYIINDLDNFIVYQSKLIDKEETFKTRNINLNDNIIIIKDSNVISDYTFIIDDIKHKNSGIVELSLVKSNKINKRRMRF